ncbi:hypothetical protein B0H10DRAFT_1708996, partial [Mycena sp. CBHHK59/15]
QSAVDLVGDMCKDCIYWFLNLRSKLPCWGPIVDREVGTYVYGLQHWIIGCLHWSFETERYFGK